VKICALPHRIWHPRRVVSETRVVGRDRLDLPSLWHEPAHVFVMPTADLFVEPEEFVSDVFNAMAAVPRHEFQVATRHVGRVLELADRLPWPPHVWLGATMDGIANEETLDQLLRTPAVVRFAHLRGPRPSPLFSLRGLDFVIVEGEPNVEELQRECDRAGVRLFSGARVETAELLNSTSIVRAGRGREGA
jgi:protein gp37